MIEVHRWDASGVVTTDPFQQPNLARERGEWIWIDVTDEDSTVVAAIGESLHLDPAVIEETVTDSHLPTIEEHLDVVFVVFHGFTVGSGGRLETLKTDIFVGKDFLITIHAGPRIGIDQVKHKMATDGNLAVGSPTGLLGVLTLNTGRRYSALMPELERQIDDLEQLAIQGDPKTAVEVQALRRDVIYLKQVLGPQFDAIEELAELDHDVIDDASRRVFGRVAAQHRRALESLESSRSLLGSVLETYRGAVADQTNEIMRVLTVFSAIMLPLTLIAGLWGMNFSQIPGSDAEWGFWALLGGMVLMAGIVWIYFARRGFIGAPRLRDLPKAVGLGLFAIGTAPVRVVTETLRGLTKPED